MAFGARHRILRRTPRVARRPTRRSNKNAWLQGTAACNQQVGYRKDTFRWPRSHATPARLEQIGVPEQNSRAENRPAGCSSSGRIRTTQDRTRAAPDIGTQLASFNFLNPLIWVVGSSGQIRSYRSWSTSRSNDVASGLWSGRLGISSCGKPLRSQPLCRALRHSGGRGDRPPVPVEWRAKLSDGFLELLGGAEGHLLARLDLDRLAGGRIAAHAGGPLAHHQNA